MQTFRHDGHVVASPKKPKRRLRVSDLPDHLQHLDLHDHSFSLTEEDMSFTEGSLTEEAFQQILETRPSELLPLPDLIDRLSQVALASADNGGAISSERKLVERGTASVLSMEEMTSILRHINLCEGTGTEPRWDLIRELTHEKAAANACQNNSGDDMAAFHESGSLPIEALYEVNDADSGFTLDAITHSCASSVTWYEGSQIEEVEITDEELDEIMVQTDAVEAASWYS